MKHLNRIWKHFRMGEAGCLFASLIVIGFTVRLGVVPAFAQVPENGIGDTSPNHWPMRIDTSAGTVTVYQPQLISFEGQKLSSRAAVSVIPTGQQDPVFGAIWMDSRVSTDRVARTVQILDITVTKARFPDVNGTAGGPTEQSLTDALRSTLPQQPMTLSLDQLLAMLDVAQKEKESAKDLSTSVPQIIFRDHASVLVQFDGEPRLSPIPNSNLLRAVNTPFFVALEPQTKVYFLKGGGQWFAASSALGSYQTVNSVPPQIAALADSSGYKDPQQALSPSQAAGIEIVTATQPSELLWTDGPEQMVPLGDTNLLYVANTTCDIFLQIDTQTIYTLASGRWFSAPHRTGPWTYVLPDQLPPDFKSIPRDSAKGSVLAHIAGTQEARDAVADTYVPQTAAIDRKTYEQPAVKYDGDPSFQPVENSGVSYAVNTPESVVLVEHRYYCCSRAVWYSSEAPAGPWDLCTNVPEAIYTIPPSCPVYPCRYVHVYDVTPDVVYCGYLPGYVGCYHHDGVVVYGTGYSYRPWEGREYYPRPCTYGYGARYDEDRNTWGFTVGLFFGSGDAWVGHHENDEEYDRDHHYDDHSEQHEWFGHGGYRPTIVRSDNNYNSEFSNRVTTINNNHNVTVNRTVYNVYERRRDVRRDPHDRPEIRTPAKHDAQRPETDQRANLADGARDNVFAGSNGNVYRKTLDGWERRENNKWVGGTSDHPADARVENRAGEQPTRDEQAQRQPQDNRTDRGHDAPAETRRDTPRATEKSNAQPNPAAKHDEPQPERRTEPRVDPKSESKTEPAPEPKAERRAAKEPEPKDGGDLNRDYRARVEGEERARHASPPPPPPHASEPPPHASEPPPHASEPPPHASDPSPKADRAHDAPTDSGKPHSGGNDSGNSGSSGSSGKHH